MATRKWDPFTKPEYISLTSRYCELDGLERVYNCEQYEGRADWWTGITRDGSEVPLREREPCVKYPLAKAATSQVVQFLFGDERFPAIKAQADDAADSVAGVSLSEEQAKEVTQWIAEAVERCQLEQQVGAIAERGISTGTSVVILGFRDGLLHLERPRAQDCWAEFREGDPALDVVRMVWCYEFEKLVADDDGKPTTKPFLFRRDYDDQGTHVYQDVELKHGEQVKWSSPELMPHGFGFCPVLWIRNESERSLGMDGRSLYEGQEGALEALDFALSQRHTGIYHAGYPQPYETGVKPGEGPGEDGRTSGPTGYSEADGKRYDVATAPARRVGPGTSLVWEDPEVTVAFRETTGKAFEATTNHVTDARSRFLESISVVLTSMADTMDASRGIGAQMSARFLSLAHAPLIALVGKYRHTWWPHGLRKLIDMLLRMLVAIEGSDDRTQRVLIPGSERVAKILAPLSSIDIGNGPQWVGPKLEPHWGRFFDPSTLEVKEAVEATAAAVELGVISIETATTHLAQEFGVDDPVAELEKAQEEAEERRLQAQEDMRAEAETLHAVGRGDTDDSKPSRGGAGAGANKKRSRGRRGGSAAAAKAKGQKGSSAQQSD